MTKEKVGISAVVDVEFNLTKGIEETEKMADNLSKIGNNMPGVGEKRAAFAKELESKMRGLTSEGQRRSAEFAKDPKARVAFEKEMLDLKMQYFKITNQITGAQIRSLALSDKEKASLDEQNKQLKAKQASFKRHTEQMEKLGEEVKAVEDARVEAMKKTGLSTSDIGSIEAIDAQIADRKRENGSPKTAKAKKEIEALEKYKKLLVEVIKKNGDWEAQQAKLASLIDEDIQGIEEARRKREEIVKTILTQAEKAGTLTDEQKELLKSLLEEKETREKIADEAAKVKAEESSKKVKDTIKDNKDLATTNEKVKKSFLGKVTAATMYYAALRTLRRALNSVVSTVTELDKSLTEVAMVTDMSREKAWELVGSYQELAFQIGITTHEIAKLSVYFFRQGRAAADALELTRVAATAAKVASIDVMDSANYLTSAINGFGMAADQAMAVSDKFAALGASSASSYEEMAIALSKVAPSAKVAGVSIDFMMGILAKGVETTREAPENIGTAFKTVFARMTQIKDFGATLEEGLSVNTVEEALKQAGVALRNSEGEFRNMDAVLTELGMNWDTLDRNQQSYIATALAGTRQQSRLLAVMQNFDRTLELVNISEESAGATLAQHAEYAGGMEAAMARLNNAWEKFILTLSNSDVIIDIINKITEAVIWLGEEIERNMPLIKTLTVLMVSFGAAVAIATAPITLLITAIGLLAGAGLYAIFRKGKTEAEKAAEKFEEMSDAIKETQVAQYNLTKQSQDLKEMSTRYDELKDKVFLTSEEMAELAQLESDISAKLGELEGEYNVKITGDIDEDLEETINFLEAQAKAEESKEVQLGVDLLTSEATNFDDLDSNDTQAVQKALAQEILGESFVNQTEETQKSIMDFVQSNYEDLLGQYSINYDDVYRAIAEERYTAQDNIEEEFNRLKDMGIDSALFGYSDELKEDYLAKATFDLDINFGKEDVSLIQDLRDVISGEITGVEAENILDQYFSITDTDVQEAIANTIDGFDTMYDALGGYTLEQMMKKDEYDIDGLSFGDQASIVGKLFDAGYDKQAIVQFFKDMGTYSEEGLSNAIEGLSDGYISTSLIEDLFGVFTGGIDEGSIADQVIGATSAIDNFLDLQEKYANGQLTQQELLEVQQQLSDQNYSKFLNNELQRNDLQQDTIDGIKEETLALIEAAKAERDFFEFGSVGYNDLTKKIETLESQYANIDNWILKSEEELNAMFDEQIQFLQDINAEKQAELDLMQQKIDMNKSMLTLERQMAALQSDTSYGAQATLRDLEEQAQASAIEREKFVMDLITEQQIAQLEEERDKAIKNLDTNVQLITDVVTKESTNVLLSSKIDAQSGLTDIGNG